MKLLTHDEAINIFIAACFESARNPFRYFGTIVYKYLPVEISSAITNTDKSMFGLTDPEQVKRMLFNLVSEEK